MGQGGKMNNYKTAQEVADIILKKRKDDQARAIVSLRSKCYQHITQMVKDRVFSIEVPIDEQDMDVVTEVVSELRDLGYRSCYVRSDKTEDLFLYITISHCVGN
jgi:hypothetical protein